MSTAKRKQMEDGDSFSAEPVKKSRSSSTAQYSMRPWIRNVVLLTLAVLGFYAAIDLVNLGKILYWISEAILGTSATNYIAPIMSIVPTVLAGAVFWLLKTIQKDEESS